MDDREKYQIIEDKIELEKSIQKLITEFALKHSDFWKDFDVDIETCEHTTIDRRKTLTQVHVEVKLII